VNAVVESLRALFVRTFHIDVPSTDTDLLETGILDSFQLVELLVQLEREFGVHITIEDIDLEDLRTLERIARLVASSPQAAAAPPLGRSPALPGETQPAPGE
jgi:D-alanine--poly(phosphoribitol) ligase subunit 2